MGLISGAVVLLTFQIHGSSPFPTFSMCIGGRPSASLHNLVPSQSTIGCRSRCQQLSHKSAKHCRPSCQPCCSRGPALISLPHRQCTSWTPWEHQCRSRGACLCRDGLLWPGGLLRMPIAPGRAAGRYFGRYRMGCACTLGAYFQRRMSQAIWHGSGSPCQERPLPRPLMGRKQREQVVALTASLQTARRQSSGIYKQHLDSLVGGKAPIYSRGFATQSCFGQPPQLGKSGQSGGGRSTDTIHALDQLC